MIFSIQVMDNCLTPQKQLQIILYWSYYIIITRQKYYGESFHSFVSKSKEPSQTTNAWTGHYIISKISFIGQSPKLQERCFSLICANLSRVSETAAKLFKAMLKSAKANEYSHTLCMFFQTIADCKPSMMLNRISTKPNPNSFTPLDPLSNCGNFVACEYSHSF